MPQRFLRPGICDSEKWNRASWEAQSLWMRLLTHVDDYGRFDGRASVICGRCFSVWNELHPKDVVNPQRTAALCGELQASELAEFYNAEGKEVVQLLGWQERARGASKWPARSDDTPLRNPAESCGILPPSPLAIALSPRHEPSPFDAFWNSYPKKVGKGAAEKAFKKMGCGSILEKLIQALELQKKMEQWTKQGGQFIPYPATWLNEKRWEDEMSTSTPQHTQEILCDDYGVPYQDLTKQRK